MDDAARDGQPQAVTLALIALGVVRSMRAAVKRLEDGDDIFGRQPRSAISDRDGDQRQCGVLAQADGNGRSGGRMADRVAQNG